MPHHVFRRKLVEQLVALGSTTAVTMPIVGRPTGKILERLTGQHFPVKIPTEHAECNKQNPTRLCVVCSPAERHILKLLDKNIDALTKRHATCANNVMCPSVLNPALSYITPSRSTFLFTNALSSRKSKSKPIHIYCCITWVPLY